MDENRNKSVCVCVCVCVVVVVDSSMFFICEGRGGVATKKRTTAVKSKYQNRVCVSCVRVLVDRAKQAFGQSIARGPVHMGKYPARVEGRCCGTGYSGLVCIGLFVSVCFSLVPRMSSCKS